MDAYKIILWKMLTDDDVVVVHHPKNADVTFHVKDPEDLDHSRPCGSALIITHRTDQWAHCASEKRSLSYFDENASRSIPVLPPILASHPSPGRRRIKCTKMEWGSNGISGCRLCECETFVESLQVAGQGCVPIQMRNFKVPNRFKWLFLSDSDETYELRIERLLHTQYQFSYLKNESHADAYSIVVNDFIRPLLGRDMLRRRGERKKIGTS